MVTSLVVTTFEVDSSPVAVEEPLGDAPKHTYASIVHVEINIDFLLLLKFHLFYCKFVINLFDYNEFVVF